MSLTPPVFVTNDPAHLTADLVASYEAMAGRKLHPAQVERLMIDLMAYEGGLQRAAIQDAAQQNLVRFARAPMLDYLGEMVGISRLHAASARTTIRFRLIAPQPTDIVIPVATRIAAKNGQTIFTTDAPLAIKAGELTGDILATAIDPGAAANGFLAGEVSTLLDPLAFVATAISVSVTAGGSDAESDDRLRARIMEAPHAFSVAGPAGSYRSFGLRAHPDITDIAVLGPEDHGVPGQIDIVVLTKSGIPGVEILSLVGNALSDSKTRPIGDYVNVLAATAIPFSVEAQVILLDGTDQTAAVEAIHAAIEALGARWRTRLGADIVQSQIIAAASAVKGVHSITLTSPAGQSLNTRQFADLTNVNVTVTGVENG